MLKNILNHHLIHEKIIYDKGGTALLWITYYDIKRKLDAMNQNEVLVESVRNETAFLYLAIIATVITVSV